MNHVSTRFNERKAASPHTESCSSKVATSDDTFAGDANMTWQQLASQGRCSFASVAEVQTRMGEIETALDGLCAEMVTVLGGAGSALMRARALRIKPAESGHKSLYECLNQIIHYWYCCAAGKHLLEHGYTQLWMRPTAADSSPKGEVGYDIQAQSQDGIQIIGEVFCVSEGLWPQKMKATYEKLSDDKSEARRLIFYNCEAKQHYKAKRAGAYFITIAVPSGDVSLACATDSRPLSGISSIRADGVTR